VTHRAGCLEPRALDIRSSAGESCIHNFGVRRKAMLLYRMKSPSHFGTEACKPKNGRPRSDLPGSATDEGTTWEERYLATARMKARPLGVPIPVTLSQPMGYFCPTPRKGLIGNEGC
jgi:hypothetical protein